MTFTAKARASNRTAKANPTPAGGFTAKRRGLIFKSRWTPCFTPPHNAYGLVRKTAHRKGFNQRGRRASMRSFLVS